MTEPLRAAFNHAYKGRFGTHLEEAEVEVLHWRLVARVRQTDARIAVSPRAVGDAVKGERQVYFPELREFIPCAVYDRYALAAGLPIAGPALIEERESTTVIGPSARATMHELGHLLVTLT
jgi:N-methylhydantoinase A